MHRRTRQALPGSGQPLKSPHSAAKRFAKNQTDTARLREAIEVAVQCSKEIFNEVIDDTTTRNHVPEFDSRVLDDDPASCTEHPRVLWGAAIRNSDVRNFNHYPVQEKPSWERYQDDLDSAPIYIGHLSPGTAGMLLWIQWFALKTLHCYEFAHRRQKQAAILLIDEIENHLHPTLQRRVIPALLDNFPRLQSFATTH